MPKRKHAVAAKAPDDGASSAAEDEDIFFEAGWSDGWRSKHHYSIADLVQHQ